MRGLCLFESPNIDQRLYRRKREVNIETRLNTFRPLALAIAETKDLKHLVKNLSDVTLKFGDTRPFVHDNRSVHFKFTVNEQKHTLTLCLMSDGPELPDTADDYPHCEFYMHLFNEETENELEIDPVDGKLNSVWGVRELDTLSQCIFRLGWKYTTVEQLRLFFLGVLHLFRAPRDLGIYHISDF